MKINKELQEAVLLGNLSSTKSLIKNGCNVDGKDKYGRTIIYDAITKGFQDIVLELCLAHTDINNQDKKGKTPLHFVSIYNQFEIAKILIQFGADVNLKDENGNSPIFDAIFNSKGNPEIIILLKENNADYLTPNNYGISPKELADSIANFNVAYVFS